MRREIAFFLGMLLVFWTCRSEPDGIPEDVTPPEETAAAIIILPDTMNSITVSATTDSMIKAEVRRSSDTLKEMIQASPYRGKDCESIYQEFYKAYREAAEGRPQWMRKLQWTDAVVADCLRKHQARFDSLEQLFPEKM
jgi:hypothetical protein